MDDDIKAVSRMPAGWQRQEALQALKAKYTKLLGSAKEATWFLAQALKSSKYRDHTGDLVSLPFGKALVERSVVEALADEAIKVGDREMAALYTKALQSAPPAAKAWDDGRFTDVYHGPAGWEMRW